MGFKMVQLQEAHSFDEERSETIVAHGKTFPGYSENLSEFPGRESNPCPFTHEISHWSAAGCLEECHISTIMDKSSWNTPRKRPVSSNVVSFSFNLQFSHFDPLSPFQCCNNVTVPTKRISTLTRGEGVKQSTKKTFLKLWKDADRSVCFAQMCQHFCLWL